MAKGEVISLMYFIGTVLRSMVRAATETFVYVSMNELRRNYYRNGNYQKQIGYSNKKSVQNKPTFKKEAKRPSCAHKKGPNSRTDYTFYRKEVNPVYGSSESRIIQQFFNDSNNKRGKQQ